MCVKFDRIVSEFIKTNYPMDYERILYSLIACHGITDLCEDPFLWIPLYLIWFSYGHYVSYEVLINDTILMTPAHLSLDVHKPGEPYELFLYNVYLFALTLLLYYRESTISQNIVVAYLGIVHTPIHLYTKFTAMNALLTFLAFGCIHTQAWVKEYFQKILRDPAFIQTETRIHRLLLSVMNAHMMVQQIIHHQNANHSQ